MPHRRLPDPAPSGSASIKSGIVATLVAHGLDTGVAIAPWFEGMRVGPRDFTGPQGPPYLTYREACRVIQRALAALPGEGLGLLLGGRQSLGEFGLLGLAMMASPNFGEAMRTAVRFAPVTGSMLDLAVVEDADGIAVTLRTRTHEPAIEAYLCEEFLASCHNLCRALLGEGFAGKRIELAYPAPAHAARYAEVLGAPVAFGRPDSRVVIAREWLAHPMPAANPVALRELVAVCRAQMPSEQPPAGIVAALQERLALQVADTPRLTDLAAELHLTERTLRRQLRAAGTSFRALHDGVRERVACELLVAGKLPIVQVAAAVGFNDARDFRRAFKRWTGRLPREMRRQCGGCALARP